MVQPMSLMNMISSGERVRSQKLRRNRISKRAFSHPRRTLKPSKRQRKSRRNCSRDTKKLKEILTWTGQLNTQADNLMVSKMFSSSPTKMIKKTTKKTASISRTKKS